MGSLSAMRQLTEMVLLCGLFLPRQYKKARILHMSVHANTNFPPF